MKDLYKVLGLLPEAEPEVIKASYKALAQKYHPDKHPDKKDLFTEIMTDLNEAHTVLCNAKRRKDYDAAWKKFIDKQAATTAPAPESSKTADAPTAPPAPSAPPPPEPPPPPPPPPPAAKKTSKHASVLKHLDNNKVDEFHLMQMYRDLFGVELKVQQGWTNHYSHVVNGKTKSYSFTELKKRIIDKLSES